MLFKVIEEVSIVFNVMMVVEMVIICLIYVVDVLILGDFVIKLKDVILLLVGLGGGGGGVCYVLIGGVFVYLLMFVLIYSGLLGLVV